MTNRPWSQPTEIPLAKLPSRRGAPGLYDAWIADVTRRMEQTPKAALAYTFVNNEEAAKHIKVGIAQIRKIHGSGYIRSQRRENIVYVYRGPNWHMPTTSQSYTPEA